MTRTFLWIVATAMLGHPSPTRAFDAGTAEDRAALFDYLLETTLERTAFSPYKTRAIGADPHLDMADYVREAMLRYRQEMIAADTDEKLFYVLQKLSSSRRDSHLGLILLEDGIQVDYNRGMIGGKIESWTEHAPIKFKPDYGTPREYELFVSDFSRDIEGYAEQAKVAIGDVLTGVNGDSIEAYLERLSRFIGKSNLNALWWDLSWTLPLKRHIVDPSLYRGDHIQLELERKDGTRYPLRLPYLRYDTIDWTGHDDRYTDRMRAYFIREDAHFAEAEERYDAWKLPGYTRVFSTPTFDFYLNGQKRAVYLKWHRFESSVREDVQRLVDHAQENGLLDHAVIFDFMRSRGGGLSGWVLQRFFGRPFKTTFGNLRISDITPRIAAQLRERAVRRKAEEGELPALRPVQDILETDNGQFLIDWLDEDVTKSIETGQAYTNNVPFKNHYLPKHSDGVVYPAPIRFAGPLVVFSGPAGCSQVEQFIAMFVDNEMGLAVGMPAGGCSNTWEWEETLHFPISGKPVVGYMWTVGHTIRPNGEVLEGNSPPVDIYEPLTRDNYLNYYDILFEHAYRYIDSQRK